MGPNWDLGTAIAIAAVPHLKDPRQIPYLWQKALLACPSVTGPKHKPGTPLTKEEQAAEEDCQQQCAALTKVCLAALPGVKRQQASLVVNGFVEVPSGLLHQKLGKRFASHAQAMSLAALAQAGKMKLDCASSGRFLKLHVEGLRKCGAPAKMVDEYVAAAREAYAEDRQVMQMLTKLQAKPAAP